MSETTGALAKKLAEVMAAVDRVPKHGRNEFHKYDYATEADIAAAVRQELAKRHVMILPSVVGHTRESDITTLAMEFLIVDGESGESFSRPWLGVGQDKGDKGGYKAMTGGEKTFLLKLFLIPTGDDPEAEETKPAKGQPQRPAPAVTRPVTPESPHRPISEGQQKRFFAIGKEKNWTSDGVKALLRRVLKVESSAQIPVNRYEEIVKMLELGPQAS